MGGVAAYCIQDPDYTGGQHVHANNSYPTGVPAWYADGVASHFYFVEVDGTPDELSPALTVAKADAQVFLDAYDADKANYVGAYSAKSIQALQDAVDAEDATAESVNAAIEAAKASAKKVEADKYYVIQNANTFDDDNLKSIYENPDGQNIAWNTKTQSAAELWQLVPPIMANTSSRAPIPASTSAMKTTAFAPRWVRPMTVRSPLLRALTTIPLDCGAMARTAAIIAT